MTFDEIGNLWCALWQQELERGNEPIAEGSERSGAFWMHMRLPDGVRLTYRKAEADEGPYSTLEYEHGFLSFDIAYGLEELDSSISHYEQKAPTNPWDEAALTMRRLLGEHATGPNCATSTPRPNVRGPFIRRK